MQKQSSWITLHCLLTLLVILFGLASCASWATTLAPTPAPGAPTQTAVIRVHPTNARTGIQDVDGIIAAALSGDSNGLRSLVRYTTTPCTKAQGMGGPPKCEPGEAEGTHVQVLPFMGAEGSFSRPKDIDLALQMRIAGLYGVYRISPSAFQEAYFPAGKYGIVFVRTDGALMTLRSDRGGIVGIVYHMNESPLSEIQREVAEWVLPPVGGSN